jgi:hypothetical protein
MNPRIWLVGAALGAFLVASVPAQAGVYLTEVVRVQGTVEVRELKEGKAVGAWRPLKAGQIVGPHFLLRTGARSFAQVNFHPEGVPVPRCVDGGSLIRVDKDAKDPRIWIRIQVLRGQLSALDGRRGKSLPVAQNP